jgi:hypothetical protein
MRTVDLIQRKRGRFSGASIAYRSRKSELRFLQTGRPNPDALAQKMRTLSWRLGQQSADLIVERELTFQFQGLEFRPARRFLAF